MDGIGMKPRSRPCGLCAGEHLRKPASLGADDDFRQFRTVRASEQTISRRWISLGHAAFRPRINQEENHENDTQRTIDHLCHQFGGLHRANGPARRARKYRQYGKHWKYRCQGLNREPGEYRIHRRPRRNRHSGIARCHRRYRCNGQPGRDRRQGQYRFNGQPHKRQHDCRCSAFALIPETADSGRRNSP